MENKMSISQKYLAFLKDYSELLFFILRQLTLYTLAYIRCKGSSKSTHIDILERESIEISNKLDIHDLEPYNNSDLLKKIVPEADV